MLAAKRSFGSLRAAARAQPQCAVVAPAVPTSSHSTFQQQRSFMSAVLLSKGEFQTKTVVELRKALSERGLSTRGKKAELVDRLVDSVSRGPYATATSPTSIVSNNNNKSSSQPPRTSSFSTTTRSKQQQQSQQQNKEDNVPSAAKVSSETVPIHSPAASAATIAAKATEGSGAANDELTAGPGLIIDKAQAEKTAQVADEVPGGAIEMPNAVFLPSLDNQVEATQQELMIPEMPHTYKNAPDHGEH